MHVWNVLHAARWKYRMQKIALLAPSHNFVGLCLRSWGMYRQLERNLLNTDTSCRCPHNMVNFGILTAETYWRVWGTRTNFNSFRVLAALLHGTLVEGVSQTLWRWTEGATYIWQGRPSRWALAHILVAHVFLQCWWMISLRSMSSSQLELRSSAWEMQKSARYVDFWHKYFM